MPKLILTFDDRVIREYGLQAEVTIGRLPDNTVVIDNPAVSGHHARVFTEGGQVVIEDLRSKNGTYVNEQHVVRGTLQDGDVVLIGKHRIVFDDSNEIEDATAGSAPPPTMGATAYLDTKQHRAMLARLREARAARDRAALAEAARETTPTSSVSDRPGMLRALAGGANDAEYRLEAQTSLIGKSKTALVRLRGWFKPQVAAAIVREGGQYFLAPAAGETLVNGDRLHGRRELLNGDVLEISGLLLEFRRDDESKAAHSHPNVA